MNNNKITGTFGTFYYTDDNKIVSKGWQCPICKNVLSPSTTYCIFCKGDTVNYMKGNTNEQ